MGGMKRQYGSGRLYIKSGAYDGHFRTPDGRRLNRRIGPVRPRGSADGLTRSQAETALRRLIEHESRRPTPVLADRRRTVDEVIAALRERLEIQRARKSGVTGARRSLPLHPVIEVLGEEEVERRLGRALEALRPS
jgi:hypothetical protein